MACIGGKQARKRVPRQVALPDDVRRAPGRSICACRSAGRAEILLASLKPQGIAVTERTNPAVPADGLTQVNAGESASSLV